MIFLRKLTLLSVFLLSIVSIALAVAADNQTVSDLPIIDAHIHYSHDVWDAIPPKDAIRRL
jgi:hypothetical protein